MHFWCLAFGFWDRMFAARRGEIHPEYGGWRADGQQCEPAHVEHRQMYRKQVLPTASSSSGRLVLLRVVTQFLCTLTTSLVCIYLISFSCRAKLVGMSFSVSPRPALSLCHVRRWTDQNVQGKAAHTDAVQLANLRWFCILKGTMW